MVTVLSLSFILVAGLYTPNLKEYGCPVTTEIQPAKKTEFPSVKKETRKKKRKKRKEKELLKKQSD